MSEPVVFDVELASAQPFFESDKSGQPVWRGWVVSFAPVVVSASEFEALARERPYKVRLQLVQGE